jgi:Ran GTPase-activating protein (RanGAP) involved in mRNA processing and transport
MPKVSEKKVGVRVMDFKGCGLTDMTLRKVAHIVKVNTTLELLHVPWNRVSDEGATCLGQSLGHNYSLVSLDLSRNSIGDEGCLRLCEGVRANSTLTKLNLDYNVDIGGPGVKGVAEMLLENSRLTELGLSGIGVGNKGALQLASALLPNTTMTVLGLSRSSIGPEGATALAKALSAPLGANQSLLSLDLSSNHIGDLGARALSTALRPEVSSSRPSTSAHPGSSPSRAEGLTDLDLRDNKLGPKAMTDIAAMLKANRVLRSLNASHNRYSTLCSFFCVHTSHLITKRHPLKNLHFLCPASSRAR